MLRYECNVSTDIAPTADACSGWMDAQHWPLRIIAPNIV
jgi:hypothetical protein